MITRKIQGKFNWKYFKKQSLLKRAGKVSLGAPPEARPEGKGRASWKARRVPPAPALQSSQQAALQAAGVLFIELCLGFAFSEMLQQKAYSTRSVCVKTVIRGLFILSSVQMPCGSCLLQSHMHAHTQEQL